MVKLFLLTQDKCTKDLDVGSDKIKEEDMRGDSSSHVKYCKSSKRYLQQKTMKKKESFAIKKIQDKR